MSGSASLGLEQAVLGHTLGFAPMASPTQVFVALCIAAPAAAPAEGTPGTEVSGLGYYRTPATFALATSPANMAANVAVIEFPMALAGWGTVGYFELWDAQIGGNRLYWGQLIDHTSGVPATLTVVSGNIVRFSPGTLAVQAASGVGGTSTSPWLPTGGGIMTGPLTLSGNATLPLHAVPLQQLPPVIVASGIVADGATDNTIVLQAAINTAQTSNTNPFATILLLPKGRILTGPLTISGQIVIEGVHDNGTVLVLKDGSAAACITISPAGTAPNPGDARRTLTLRNLRIENQTWYSGNAAAHGINLAASGAWPCRVTLSQVTVYGMPGSGINAVAFLGWVELYDCSLFHNGLYGADCNSCFDWKWFGGDIALNGIAGARLSGCGSFVWSGTNCYSNASYNLQLFSAVGSYSGNHRFSNCNFDRSNQVGVYYDVRDVMGVVFDGCTFTNCSTVTPNTYSDVLITSSANNLAVFTACVWGNNNANDATYSEKWALEFQGTTQTVVLDGNNTFWGGTHRTNGPAQIFLATGLATFANNLRVNGNVGFYNTAPVAKPTVSGAKGSNAALASLIAALVSQGLVTDTTTA